MSQSYKALYPISSATLCTSFTEKEIELKVSTSKEVEVEPQPSTSKDPKSG